MTGGRGVFHAASIAVSLLSTRHVLLAQLLPPLLGSDAEVSEVRTYSMMHTVHDCYGPFIC